MRKGFHASDDPTVSLGQCARHHDRCKSRCKRLAVVAYGSRPSESAIGTTSPGNGRLTYGRSNIFVREDITILAARSESVRVFLPMQPSDRTTFVPLSGTLDIFLEREFE